ncbi:hypothetical protein HO173_004620 [Letharia columbiana]|uniref:Zn(2)-C6 fungal-type domain-containing protein n=1 Tax=Letharia columbiana TaxID=112416 RepID=A0A8H6FYL5_9LECA|nr:uncharacterized protein HO173_004620 [Letharia columbiana]KAF6237152.1 hypothetical protein HO173_004620 [Letharia columbiana]
MSSNGTAREERSPHDETPASKRRRIAFSCLDCRRRKLKCDRLFPSCTRCQKGGHPESCTYDNEAVELATTQSSGEKNRTRDFPTANGHGAPRTIPRLPSVARSFAADEGEEAYPRPHSEDTTTRLYAQEERIRQLECRIIGLEKATHGARIPELTQAELSIHSNRMAAADKETMIFRGKHFKTQFYGASHHTSYLSHLPELRLFMKDMIVQHQGLASVQRELHNTKIKGPGQEDSLPTNDKALISLLPQKKVADQLVQIYVENLESTYRVLHLPTFWEEYSSFWKAPQEGRPAFAALLLLILASTYCVKEKDSSMFRGDSSVGRETAIMWIRTCDSWLQSQSQKHTNMTVFQIHCLSFVAKQMNSIKRKRTWTSAGNLMRLALSNGLHRDANIINLRHATPSSKKVSAFDQEMRRRIWATISELELQAAFDRGMPAMLRDLVEDCGPPLNLDDEEFDPSAEQLPGPRPVSQYTRSTFQHLSRLSWSLRLELVSVINGPHPQMAYEDVLLYDRKIMQYLAEIPHWSDQASVVSRVLLQLQLQVLLLFLHRPFAREEARGSRYDYSAIMHLRSAMNILDLHHQLTSTGNTFLCLFRSDIFGAALSICYNYSASEPNTDQNLFSRSSIKQSSSDPLPYLEKALNMIGEKIMCVGIGLPEYYCVCAMIGLLKKKQSPSLEQSRYEEQKAAYKVTQMTQRVMSLQDNYSAAATLASLPNMPVSAPTGLLGNGSSNGNAIGPSAQMDGTDMLEEYGQDFEGLDLTDIAGWDLEAFWNF